MTNRTGMAAVLVPHGPLFRAAADEQNRAAMLQEDLYEAVVNLPAGTFPGTTLPTAICVFRRAKPRERRSRVMFIDLAVAAPPNRSAGAVDTAQVERAVAAFRSFVNDDGLARVVPVAEIRENEWNLVPSRYVAPATAEARLDIGAEYARLRKLEQARDDATARLELVANELGLLPPVAGQP